MKKNKRKFNRYYAFIICIVFVYTAIISRVFYLQIIKGEYYSEKANSKTHKMLLKAAPRGEIYDTNGNILATSRQSFMLIFTETDESKKNFYSTMTKVFNILAENKADIEDDFILKTDPFRFEVNASSEKDRKWSENRFKKDRGVDEYALKNSEFKEKKITELTKEEKQKLEQKVSDITAEEVFDYLISQDSYKIYDLALSDYIDEQWEKVSDKSGTDKEKWTEELVKQWNKLKSEYKVSYLKSKYDNNTIRKYMIIKDTIKMQSFSGYKPVVIANDLSEELSYIFEQLQSDLPGISITKQPIREYPNGDVASSILGYIRKINGSEQAKYEEKGYSTSTDYIGAAGIEQEYEEILKGTKGQESIETNKLGRKIKTLGEQTPYPGNNIQLTIDRDLQKIAEKALDDELERLRKLGDRKPTGGKDDANKTNATRGAAVALNVNTGAVLALASRPGYDPNLFTTPGKLTAEEYKKYFNPDLDKFGREYIKNSGLLKLSEFNGTKISSMSSEKKMEFLMEQLFPLDKSIQGNKTIREDRYDIYPKPFYNYATKSLIPPGSIFKPVTSIAGLEEGVITAETRIYDAGPYNKRYKEFKGASWMYNLYKGSHGNQNLAEALRDSNNYYMYEIADRLFAKGGVETKEGLNGIAKYAWQLGLGADPNNNPVYSTGIEIDENFGQVYNYESGKRTLTVLYTQKLYEYLQTGTSSVWGISYKGIDIVPTSSENEKIKNVKKQLSENVKKDVSEEGKLLTDATIKNITKELKDKNYKDSDIKGFIENVQVYNLKKKLTEDIKKEMTSDKKGTIDTSIKDTLKKLINTSKELQSKSYTDKDINNMIEAIQGSVNDARSEIKSGTNLYSASIGQGLNQFTPIQLANYVATLVNGGNRYKVHIVDKVTDPEGNVIKDHSQKPQVMGKANFSSANIESVKRGMKDVTSDGGTAATTFKNFPIHSGGKTGSATFSNVQDEVGRTSYGNFIGFAPYDKPEIAVVVILFDGGHGAYASEVAKVIYEQYFKDEILKINPKYKFTYPEITTPKSTKDDDNKDEKENKDKESEVKKATSTNNKSSNNKDNNSKKNDSKNNSSTNEDKKYNNNENLGNNKVNTEKKEEQGT